MIIIGGRINRQGRRYKLSIDQQGRHEKFYVFTITISFYLDGFFFNIVITFLAPPFTVTNKPANILHYSSLLHQGNNKDCNNNNNNNNICSASVQQLSEFDR
jgi:hypothetical protein